jgi:O-antigen ligase
MSTEKYKQFLTQAGVISVVAACFCIPLSTSLMAVTTSLVLLFWVLSGQFLLLPKILRISSVSLIATLLFILFLVGIFYSSVEPIEALSTLKKYRELIFFPVVISFLIDRPKARKWAENSFVAGCIFLLFISFAMHYSIIPSHKFGSSLIHHIPHSYFMAILSFFAIHRAMEKGHQRFFWIFLLPCIVINFLFIAPGRTGMLIFLVLMTLFCLQKLTLKYQSLACILLCSLAAMSYYFSNHVASRVDAAIHEINKFEQGKSRTSLGNRFNWYFNSVDLIKEKPLLGHGTGSFETEHRRIIKGTRILLTNNPHNDYFFIGVQLGLIGLALFLLLLIFQLFYSLRLPPPKSWLLQGITLAMAAGCLINSMLYDSLEGHFFVFLSSVLLAAPNKQKEP